MPLGSGEKLSGSEECSGIKLFMFWEMGDLPFCGLTHGTQLDPVLFYYKKRNL